MTTPLNPVDNKSNDYGFLISKNYDYRLVPFESEFNWYCGVFSSNIFDKSYQISAQGINSMRINANLSFDLSRAEAEDFIYNLKNNQVNTVMTPSSYIDPSGVLKEILLYVDNLSIKETENNRLIITLALVTDTASAIMNWRESSFNNATVLTQDDFDKGHPYLEKYDIVYDNKTFYYIFEDVIDAVILGKYDGSLVKAAKDVGKKFVLPLEVASPFERSISPDYYINDFKESYPVRAWKGEQTYDYQEIEIAKESVDIKELQCSLHFLEHQYGYKNFKIPQIMNDLYWWNTQKWTHSWNIGDYHSLSISVNQNHAPSTYK